MDLPHVEYFASQISPWNEGSPGRAGRCSGRGGVCTGTTLSQLSWPSRCSCSCDCSKWTLCKKMPFSFSCCKALAASHRSSFRTVLAAARYWMAPGRTDILSSRRLWQPLSLHSVGLDLQSIEAAGFLQRFLSVLLPPWQCGGTNVVTLWTCLPWRAPVWGSLGNFGVDGV